MIGVHRALGTWGRKVNILIALTNFAYRKHIQDGLPANKIVVKPKFFQPDSGIGSKGGFRVFY